MAPTLTGEGLDEPALAAAIAAVPGWRDVSEVEVALLTAGITNRNYLLRADGERVVVRVFGADTELLGIDREAEEVAARSAAAAGVGPQVVAFLPEAGCLVSRFVDGATVPEDDLQRPDVIAAVVRSVRAIHACDPIPSAFPVFRVVEDYADLARARGVGLPPTYDEARAIAARIESAFARAPMRSKTCHNDLLNANFLMDGEHVWILDYEYAGMGDPFFDLGNLSINNGLSDEAQGYLLSAYFHDDVRDVHRARLGLMRVMSDFREAMWGVVQQTLSTLDIDYVDYADRHFERLLASADDDRFADWLAAAGERL